MNIRFALVLLIAALTLACSNVRPVPVTAANAGAPGLRFYMTRPFIVVNRPFPIQSEVHLARALVSADGARVRILSGPPELTALIGTLPTEVNADRVWVMPRQPGAGPAPEVADGDRHAPRPRAQGSEGDAGSEPPAGGAATTPEKPASASDTGAESRRIAMANITATTDITALPRFQLNESVSLIFLPDFEREFVVETRNKLGLTRATLNMGPGNTFLGFSAEVDNSAIGELLVDSFRTLLDAGTQNLLGLLPSTTPTAQSSPGNLRDQQVADREVTLRVHRIRMAAIGVYPLTKPNEVASDPKPDTDRNYLRPVAGYQVPYDYYEVLLFEALLDDSSWAWPGAASSGGGGAQAQAPRAEICSGRPNEAMLESWWGRRKRELDQAAGGKLAAYALEVAMEDPAAECHANVTLTLVGPAPADAALMQGVKAAFEKEYGNARATMATRTPAP
ncbi:hypothetical protein [Arenimonas composti]|uniref:Uncharacterized protein n=1 Tax=Arenimonas composti TR7-09 = DSM 18010 TaxID=1121013 RepID=A0A091B906_9GAMM|nr:hypothetical protein [Arenimonas composti]KFN48231.1 hypothetical protein P873_01355 [Arenimonas composti TR7-09 = DSM 18010]